MKIIYIKKNYLKKIFNKIIIFFFFLNNNNYYNVNININFEHIIITINKYYLL